MGKKIDINDVPVNLDSVPEHMRERARAAIDQFMSSPEGASMFAEAMSQSMNRGQGTVIPLEIGDDDEDERPPYPPLSPEADHLVGLIALEIAGDAEEWDGETDGQTVRIGREIDRLRFLTEAEKRDAYRTIINARRLGIDYNECWVVCHKQLTLAHNTIAEEGDDGCEPRLHATVEHDTLRDLAKTLSPNLASLSLMIGQMERCDTEIQALIAAIDKRAHEAGEWPMPSPVNADPA
jgi:hypothetical protein